MNDVEANLTPVTAAMARLEPRRLRLHYDVLTAGALRVPLANDLRGALGKAVVGDGAGPDLAGLAWEGDWPPALWFRGWHAPRLDVGTVLPVELVVLGHAMSHWNDLLGHLAAMNAHSVRLGLGDVAELAPQIPPGPGLVIVETRSPLQLRSSGRPVQGPPGLGVLVRSAAERLRQLDQRWGAADPALPAALGPIVRGATAQPFELAATDVVKARRGTADSSQSVGGVVGRWSYEAVKSEEVALLDWGQIVGIGRGVAFGCGEYRLE